MNNLVSSEQLAYVLNKSTKTIKHSLRRMQRDNRVEIVETKKEKTAHIGRFSDVFYMKPECAMTLVKSSRRSKEKADVIKHYEKTGEIKPLPEKFIEEKKVEKERKINKFKSKRTEFPPLKTEYVVWMFGGQAQFVGATKIPTSEVESFGEYVPDHHLPAIYKILDSDAK